MGIKFGNCSHQGDREYQEDSFGFSNIIDSDIVNEKGFAAVLADGMGGLANGREISEYAVTSFIGMFNALDYAIPFHSQLESIVEKINESAIEKFSIGGAVMAGSTLAAVFVYNAELYWICVGDSRLYLMRNGRLHAVNEDHDYFNQLLPEYMSDCLNIDEIMADMQRDNLTSYIGNNKLPYIDANRIGFPLKNGDMLVLCSDGVYGNITGAEIIDILRSDEPQTACERIVQAVLNKNTAGQDNLTVIIIKIEEE